MFIRNKMITLPKEAEKKFQEFLNRGNPPCNYERQVLDQHSDRITHILEGGNPPPYELEIQPSSSCNLACKFCFGKDYPRLPNSIGEEEMKEIAKKIDDFRDGKFVVETIKFCGTTGEPLVNPQTPKAIRLFKSMGKNVIVFTNGLFLDKQLGNEQYLDYVLDADSLNLSLDSGSESSFYFLKGRQGFGKITNTLEKMVAKRNSQKKNLWITIRYVVGRDNATEIIQATRLAREIGVNEIRFRADFTNGISHGEISEVVEEQLAKAKQYQQSEFAVNVAYSEGDIGSDKKRTKGLCFNSHFWACIGPDAELYSCGHRTYGGVRSFGSVLEHPLQELWNNPERRMCLSNLPDKFCDYCSPSSMARNELGRFLLEQPETSKALLKKHKGS